MLKFMCTLQMASQQVLARIQPRKDDRGQTAVEYGGLVLVIIVVIGALSQTKIGEAIGAGMIKKIGDLFK
jgi:Flp pilus assembly pilin Flp